MGLEHEHYDIITTWIRILIVICTKCFKAPYYTRCGTTFMGKTPSTEDAHIVKKLRDGGAIIIGIANMHELGIGTTGNNPNR